MAAIVTAGLMALIVGAIGLLIAFGSDGGDEREAEEARATATRARPAPATRSTPEATGSAEAFRPGNLLGLRCSTASKFLRDRYGLDERNGCVILRIDGRSGAEAAGLRIGDKILEVYSVPITSGRQFSYVFERNATSNMPLKIERRGQTMTVDVRLGRYADPAVNDPYFDYLVARGNPDPNVAIEYFSLQIRRDPEFDLAYAYRAEYLIDESLPGELSLSHAENDLREALRIDPELAEAHEIYARMLSWKMARHDDALAHIEQAIAIAGCEPPIGSDDVDCGEILMTRAEIYLARKAPGDVELIRQDVGTVATVEAVARRAAGIASQADSNDREAQRGAGRCTNEADIVFPCALWLGHSDWTLETLAEQESTVRMIMENIADERMQETRFTLAQLTANQGGGLGEAIEQLTLAMDDAYCGESEAITDQCAKYVFARAQSYYVRDEPGDLALAEADFLVAAQYDTYRDEATKSLEFIRLGR
jgi:tetratricopeptide (TPR) repeat protein